jgi:UDP-N-acetylmuramoyl-tripeptide--D-alanyl-D-alanine ligase
MPESSPAYIRALYLRFLASSGVSTDSRQLQPGNLFFALKGPHFDGNQYAAAALRAGARFAVVDDPAVVEDDNYVLVPDVLAALQELARHHRRHFSQPVLALTGSNGKTTTKELLAGVLSMQYRVHATIGNLNNHIGVPLTLLAMSLDTEIAVIEMGANHQQEIAALCRIAEPTHGLITNIGSAHLEGFGGIPGVIKGKGELFDYLRDHRGVAFVNLNDEHLPAMGHRVPQRVEYTVSDRPDPTHAPMEAKLLATHPNVRVAFLGEGGQLLEVTTHLPGAHNFQNILAAIAVAKYFKVPGRKIAAALAAYVPSNNRSQRLRYREVDFLLDAYNANPSSVAATLRTFAELSQGRGAAVLGEMRELGAEAPAAHQRIAVLARELGLDPVILVGPAFAATAERLGLRYFPDTAALKEWFWQQDWRGRFVLLKASRGVALEGVLADTD